jgi:hypothetical protein
VPTKKQQPETRYWRRSIDVLHFERHDPHDVVAIEMRATGGRKKPRKFTMIREMRDSIRERGYWGGRGDIVMVNMWSGEWHKQYTASPTWSGEPRGEAMQFLTPEEIERAREQNRKILAATEEYPEMAFLLSGRREDGQSTREWVAEQLLERKKSAPQAQPR